MTDERTMEAPSRAALHSTILRTFANRPDLQERIKARLNQTPEEDAAYFEAEERRHREVAIISRRAERIRNCGLSGRQRKHSFASFIKAGEQSDWETQKRAWDAAQAFSRVFPGVDRGLMLYGLPGVGKDYLLHCIVNALLARGQWDIRYWYSLDYAKALNDEWDKWGDKEQTNVEEWARKSDLLLIGDLHQIAAASYARDPRRTSVRESIMRVVNQAEATGKPIVCATSNWDQAAFDEECLAAMGSRAAGIFDWYELRGPDRRRAR